jgi:MFS transporter, DHA1 family, multidrug resistance protein
MASAPAPLSSNIRVLLGISVVFGAAVGLYDFVLPYYLQERGLSYPSMGWLFAASAAVMVVIRLATGRLVDTWGCKRPYLLALLGGGVTNLLTALTGNVVALTVLKTGREVTLLLRETVHPVLLYIEDRVRFRDLVGKTKGLESLCQALGTLLAGYCMVSFGNGPSMLVSAVILGAAGALLGFGLKDRRTSPEGAPPKGVWWRWDVDRNLKVIMVSGIVFNLGLTTSHGFIMPLYFSARFGASEGTVAAVMFVHRLTPVLPMLLAGRLRFGDLKAAYIMALVLEGILISAGGLIPSLVPAAAIWLLHDLVGAGVWIPIQSEIIQRHCRDSTRGLDLSKTLVLSSVGGAFGPILSGFLAERSIGAPFVVSGILVVVGGLMLFALRLEPERSPAPAPTAP